MLLSVYHPDVNSNSIYNDTNLLQQGNVQNESLSKENKIASEGILGTNEFKKLAP